jgi:hypothetical protein
MCQSAVVTIADVVVSSLSKRTGVDSALEDWSGAGLTCCAHIGHFSAWPCPAWNV